MQHVPLADVSFGGAVDVAQRIAAAGVDPRTRTERLADHIAGYVSGLRRCRGLARRARELIASGESGTKLERIEHSLAESLRPLGFASLLAQHEIERAQDRATRAASSEEYLAASSALLVTLDTVIAKLEPTLARASTELGRSHG
jgi:hypothetical protein